MSDLQTPDYDQNQAALVLGDALQGLAAELNISSAQAHAMFKGALAEFEELSGVELDPAKL